MKNKVSTTAIAVPMENKKAKAELQQTYADISAAEIKREQMANDQTIILGASQDKEAVLVELDAAKTELSNAKKELATAKQNKADIVDETIKCSEELRLRQADVAKLDGLNAELGTVNEKIGAGGKTLEKQNDESRKLALQIEVDKRIIADLEAEQQEKIKEATQNLQKLSDDAKSAQDKLTLADEELNKVELDILDRKKELESLNKNIEDQTNAKNLLIAESDALNLEIVNKKEEAHNQLDAELAEKQTKFDKSIAKKQEELTNREGELSLNERQIKVKQDQILEVHKSLEEAYGRKLPPIKF